jgi:hypothetical protein
VYSPCLSPDISIRAKSPLAGKNADISVAFIPKPEAFMQGIISLIAEKATLG